MNLFNKLVGASPFTMLLEHTRKVHECVQLLQPLTDALLSEDHTRIEELHNLMALKEHEADQIKTSLRDRLGKAHLLSVRRDDLMRFLSYQDNVADAAQDYAVVLLLRKTRLPQEIQQDFKDFVAQVIVVSEHLLSLAEELSAVVESAFSGAEAKKVLENVEEIGKEEWKADRLERKFSLHFYQLEDQLDPVTILFLDKYCSTLGAVANSAEATAKYLRQIISG